MPYQDKTFKLIDQLPNSNHNFFTQVCSSKGEHLRFILASILDLAPNSLSQHWEELLHSFDNALFFQAVGEMLSFSSLHEQGWRANDYDKNPGTIDLSHQTGQVAKLLCLSFLCERNPELEQNLALYLEDGLNNIDTLRS